MPTTKQPIHFLTKDEVLKRTRVAYPTIWNWMRDGTFPLGRVLGGHGGKTVWIESEIDEWCAARPVRAYTKRDRRQRAEARS